MVIAIWSDMCQGNESILLNTCAPIASPFCPHRQRLRVDSSLGGLGFPGGVHHSPSSSQTPSFLPSQPQAQASPSKAIGNCLPIYLPTSKASFTRAIILQNPPLRQPTGLQKRPLTTSALHCDSNHSLASVLIGCCIVCFFQ